MKDEKKDEVKHDDVKHEVKEHKKVKATAVAPSGEHPVEPVVEQSVLEKFACPLPSGEPFVPVNPPVSKEKLDSGDATGTFIATGGEGVSQQFRK